MAKPSPQHSNTKSLNALGKAIREHRKSQGVSQEALALKANLDRSYVGGVERGEHNITTINLIRLAAALNIRASELLYKSGL